MSPTSIFGRIAGVDEIKAELEAQGHATREHRAWEGERLRAIETTGEETKALAIKTNGRVNEHDVQLALIARDEERAAELDAAKVKAEAVVVNRKLTWRQGLTFAVVGAVVAGLMGGVGYLIAIAVG